VRAPRVLLEVAALLMVAFGIAMLLIAATVVIAWSAPAPVADQYEQDCRQHITIPGNPTPAQREAAIRQCAAVTRYMATGQIPPGWRAGPNGSLSSPGGTVVQHQVPGAL
jgi:hypothetical protein